MKALLTVGALQRFEDDTYRFCPNPSCRIVYFSACGRTFVTGDLRVPVWQKAPPGRRMICYCFGENEAAIGAEVRDRGVSGAVDRVKRHVAAHRCACDLRNPRGVCCLGELIAAVKRVAASVGRQEPVDASADR